MPYKAKIEIGGYKPGEVVPDEKAEIWGKMYKESPVEKVEPEIKVPEKKPKKGASLDIMIDDYLDRNASVIIRNVLEDDLSIDTLHGLLDWETRDKKRGRVLKAIEEKIKEVEGV